MKKLAILLLAGATIGFASCGDDTNTSTTEQIDSMATYRTDTMTAALKAQNDSLINTMAQMRADSAMRADSMARVMKGKTITTTTTKTTTRPATTKPTTTTTKDGRLNVDQNTSKNNDGRLNVDKNTESKDKTKGKDGRLKVD